MNYETLIEDKRRLRKHEELVNKILKPYGITSGGWLMLNLVRDRGGVTVSDLSGAIGTSTAFITTTMKLLIALGHVSMSAGEFSDNRKKLITYSGGPVLTEMNKKIAKALA